MVDQAPVRVIKLGGSVLTGPKAYARAARWIARRWREGTGLRSRWLIVVSAESGMTDGLLAEASAITPRPDQRALDLLWATGELRSTALLALHLQSIGIPGCALNAHEVGLYRSGAALAVRTRHLRRALETHAVVVAPGFVAATPSRAMITLGRGGSDLSAVVLAAALGAGLCELIKDVPGYFTADPARDTAAQHIPFLDVDEALRMAESGCDLVQADALQAARRHGVRLLITTTQADDRRTIVFTQGESHAICHQDHPRRAAVGA